MGTLAVGAVVLVRFPFSDLSQAKLRPAVILADTGRGDWLLCQITSKPYGDRRAIVITDTDFRRGSLRVASFARPAKLFTAHESLISSDIGALHDSSLERIVAVLIQMLSSRRR